jgi:signal transduction histidine kinase
VLPFRVVNVSDERARERLVAIGEIAAEIAHELRNVLQLISTTAFLARQDPGQSLPHIERIERYARTAHGIVNDLMALARGEPAAAEPVLFAEVLVAARVDVDPEAASWEDVVVPASLRVRAHPGLVARVLHVLYDNAILAARPRAPRIVTRAERVAGAVRIEVADDGPGVPEAIAGRLFQPFVTGRADGTGLGLALAQRIVAAHGGSVCLAGEPAGKSGACFRVDLPDAATPTT